MVLAILYLPNLFGEAPHFFGPWVLCVAASCLLVEYLLTRKILAAHGFRAVFAGFVLVHLITFPLALFCGRFLSVLAETIPLALEPVLHPRTPCIPPLATLVGITGHHETHCSKTLVSMRTPPSGLNESLTEHLRKQDIADYLEWIAGQSADERRLFLEQADTAAKSDDLLHQHLLHWASQSPQAAQAWIDRMLPDTKWPGSEAGGDVEAVACLGKLFGKRPLVLARLKRAFHPTMRRLGPEATLAWLSKAANVPQPLAEWGAPISTSTTGAPQAALLAAAAELFYAEHPSMFIEWLRNDGPHGGALSSCDPIWQSEGDDLFSTMAATDLHGTCALWEELHARARAREQAEPYKEHRILERDLVTVWETLVGVAARTDHVGSRAWFLRTLARFENSSYSATATYAAHWPADDLDAALPWAVEHVNPWFFLMGLADAMTLEQRFEALFGLPSPPPSAVWHLFKEATQQWGEHRAATYIPRLPADLRVPTWSTIVLELADLRTKEDPVARLENFLPLVPPDEVRSMRKAVLESWMSGDRHHLMNAWIRREPAGSALRANMIEWACYAEGWRGPVHEPYFEELVEGLDESERALGRTAIEKGVADEKDMNADENAPVFEGSMWECRRAPKP